MEKEKLEQYKNWMCNLSFFNDHSFIIDNIENLWQLTNYIGFSFSKYIDDKYKVELDYSSINLEETINLAQDFFKNHNFNVVKYKKEKEVYISEEDQDIGDQIINDQFGRIDEKSRREYGKRDEAKTYNLGKRKEINKKIKNVKYKKEETKSEFQKKKKTYIDQIEEQQHAIKSQIISKK